MKNLNYLLFIIICFCSCSIKKEIVIPKEKLKNISEARLFKEIESNSLKYKSLYFKKFDCSASYKDTKLSFKGSLFVKKDSQIIISIVPIMRIELYKISISPNEVILIDRVKKEVTYGNIELINSKLDIDFSFFDIQNILANEFFGLNCNETILKDCFKKFKVGDNNKQYFLRSFSERKLEKIEKTGLQNIIFIEYLINPILYRIEDVNMHQLPQNEDVNIKYSDFLSQENLIFPHKLLIEGNKSNILFRLSIIADIIEIDSKNEIGFKIPEKYTKVFSK